MNLLSRLFETTEEPSHIHIERPKRSIQRQTRYIGVGVDTHTDSRARQVDVEADACAELRELR